MFHADVFEAMINKIQNMADDFDPAPEKVLRRGYF